MYQHLLVSESWILTAGWSYIQSDNVLNLVTEVEVRDMSGVLITSKQYYSPDWFWDPAQDCNTILNDTIFAIGIIRIKTDNDTVFNSIVQIIHEGDTSNIEDFISPYFFVEETPTFHHVPASVVYDTLNQNFYFASRIVDYPPIQNNFIIRKINSQGEVVWTYINPINPNYYACSAMIYQGSSLWALVAGWGLNSYNKVVQINTETGEFVNEIVLQSNPNNLAFAEELFKDAEGFVVSCLTSNNQSNTIPAIYKMDFNGNLIWYSHPDGDFAFDQKNNHLVQSNDGGFVSCGEKYDEEPSWLYPNDPAMNNTMKRIWLWKVDANGNFLWQRFYSYYDFDYSSEYFHLTNIAHDMKATPDGGFIMAGEASAACTDYPDCDNFTQQGWLLKVDACGCLVPGCDPNCIVSVEEKEETEEQTYFRFGPNPMGDLLNLYIPSLPFSIKEVTFSLIDMNGRTIKDFQFQYDNTTYMIDTYSLTAGNYILSLTKDGQVLQREKVLKD